MQVITSTICTAVLDGYNNYFYSLLLNYTMFTEVVIETTATVALISVFLMTNLYTTYIHI